MRFDFIRDVRSYIRPAGRRIRGESQALIRRLQDGLPMGSKVHTLPGYQWRRVLRRSRRRLDALPEAVGDRVLFATSYGFSEAMQCLEGILMTSLRLRGARVASVLCGHSLPSCEFNRWGNFEPDPGEFGPRESARTKLDRCRICQDNATEALEPLPIEFYRFSEYLRSDDLDRISAMVDEETFESYGAMVYRDIAVGEQAFSSVMRAQLRGTLEETPETRWLFRRYLVSCMLVCDLINRVLDDYQPDHLVTVHGVYCTHGTICGVARQRGIHVIVYGMPYRINTVWLSHHDTYHRTLISMKREDWDAFPLTPERERRVDEYFAEKRFGGRDYAGYHKGAIDDREAFLKASGLDSGRPIVSLFTNVLWDAQLYYRHNAFGTMLDWLFETIDFFLERPEIQLVIRVHPAEAKGLLPTNQPLVPEIEKRFPFLPDHVLLIAPESPLSSYTLAQLSRAAVIYGARMGFEIAALGTPLLVTGQTFNRGKGFSMDFDSREDYFHQLQTIDQLAPNSDDVVRQAKKWAYHFLYRMMIDFPYYQVTSSVHLSYPELTFRSLDDLMPGRHPGLDKICSGICDPTVPFWVDELDDRCPEGVHSGA